MAAKEVAEWRSGLSAAGGVGEAQRAAQDDGAEGAQELVRKQHTVLLSRALEWALPTHPYREEVSEALPTLVKLLNDGLASASLLLPTSTIEQQWITMLLRLLRNLCVHSATNQTLIGQSGVLESLTEIATQCTKAIASTSVRQEDGVALLRVTLQVLTNASTSHQHNQQLVWERLFPDGFSDLLRVNDDSSISHTCILIFNSCALSSSRRTELAHANKLLTVLLEQLENNSLSSLSSSSPSSVNSPAKERIIEWLLRLFTLLVEDGHFETMHNTLGTVGQHPFSKERAALLKVLDGMLCKMLNPLAEEDSEEKEERGQVSDDNSTASERLENVQLASFLAPSIIQTLAIDLQDIFLYFNQQPNKEEREEAEEAEEPKRAKLLDELKDGSLQTASLPVAYCWLLLQGLASITALVFSHSYRHSPSFPSAQALKDAFSSSNVLTTVLEFLEWAVKYLGAAYYRFDKTNEEEQHLSFALKRDLVRVLCNMCFRDKHNQDLVRENGGLPLILNLCRIDEKNPYIREWCLLAIRNLCEENAANQAFIAGLDLKGAASNKELAEMGLKVEVANEDTEGPPTRFPSSYHRPTTTATRVTLRKADAEQQKKGEEGEEDKDQNE